MKVYIIGLYFLLVQVLEKWDHHLVKVWVGNWATFYTAAFMVKASFLGQTATVVLLLLPGSSALSKEESSFPALASFVICS